MAIFTPGPATGAISGDVGGANFALSRSGPVMRQKRRTQSNAQSTLDDAKVAMRNNVNRWKALSDDDRQAWRTYASTITFPNRLGHQRNLSGYQLFMKMNLHQEIDDPPIGTLATTAVRVSFTAADPSTMTVEFDGLPALTAYAGFLYGNRLYRDTPVKFNRDWRRLGLVSTLGTVSVSIVTQWESVFTFPAQNEYIALQFRPFADGRDLGGWTTQILQTS